MTTFFVYILAIKGGSGGIMLTVIGLVQEIMWPKANKQKLLPGGTTHSRCKRWIQAINKPHLTFSLKVPLCSSLIWVFSQLWQSAACNSAYCFKMALSLSTYQHLASDLMISLETPQDWCYFYKTAAVAFEWRGKVCWRLFWEFYRSGRGRINQHICVCVCACACACACAREKRRRWGRVLWP